MRGGGTENNQEAGEAHCCGRIKPKDQNQQVQGNNAQVKFQQVLYIMVKTGAFQQTPPLRYELFLELRSSEGVDPSAARGRTPQPGGPGPRPDSAAKPGVDPQKQSNAGKSCVGFFLRLTSPKQDGSNLNGSSESRDEKPPTCGCRPRVFEGMR